MEKRVKIRYTTEEATQFVLDLPSDSELSDLEDSSDEEANLEELQNGTDEEDENCDTVDDDVPNDDEEKDKWYIFLLFLYKCWSYPKLPISK